MSDVMKYWYVIYRVFCGVAIFISLVGCSGTADDAASGNILVRIGSNTLTATEMQKSIPGGLTPDDSVRFVRAYIKEWIDSHLISDIASEDVDMDEINRLTDEYRTSLIMLEYRRRMFEAHGGSIPDDSIQAYYEMHKSDFILERPLVKGTYLKVPDDAKNLKTLRRLYASDNSADIDRLEKEVLTSAIHYDYFRDHWVDWEQIETRIPYDFGSSSDQWLRQHKSLDESLGGFTYLLAVTDVLPTGSPMPLEAAKPQIIRRLLNINRQAYDATLTRDLYDHAIQSGRLVINVPLE